MPHEGVNIMRLVNLNALYIDMQQHNADSMVFAAQVKGHPFSCTFAKVIGTLHKLGQGDPRLQSWEELPVHILSIR